MKTLSEKYNKAVDHVRKLVSGWFPPPQPLPLNPPTLPLSFPLYIQWSGRQPPPCIDAPPSLSLLKHILDQVYNRAITKPEELNTYQAFSPEVGVVCINIGVVCIRAPLYNALLTISVITLDVYVLVPA